MLTKRPLRLALACSVILAMPLIACDENPSRFATGEQPNLPSDWKGGFLCPCHGSTFDLSARVYQNKPAPTNLDVPPYMFLAGGSKIVIGKDEKGEA